MNIRILNTVALCAIAFGIVRMSLKPETQPQIEPTVKTHVFDVIDKVTLDYNPYGVGSTGFLVMDGNKLEFIPIEVGSRIEKMPTPNQVLIVDHSKYGRDVLPLDVQRNAFANSSRRNVVSYDYYDEYYDPYDIYDYDYGYDAPAKGTTVKPAKPATKNLEKAPLIGKP